ncbi:hypothetical protein O9929_05545 [Vibrio lentus]|nr:hypothetical protein [Vibrio lentus]
MFGLPNVNVSYFDIDISSSWFIDFISDIQLHLPQSKTRYSRECNDIHLTQALDYPEASMTCRHLEPL